MALIDMYEKISDAIDRKEHSIGIFIDLSKAFDTINHEILMKKLYHYGIRGIAHSWFNSYLTNRKQLVYIEGVYSPLCNITCGVPQGSILGPLLFVLYVNDIINSSKCLQFILFADDTNLFYSCTDLTMLQNVVNTELAQLSDWFKANKLSLNINKTCYIIFRNKHNPIKRVGADVLITIDDMLVNHAECVKFLGVMIDSQLKWDQHILNLTKKISRGIGAIYCARSILSTKLKLMLYRTMIYPYLIYCNIVWGSANKTLLHRLLVLQKCAIRFITNSDYCDPSAPLFVSTGLLKINDIHSFLTLQYMFKVKNRLLPASCMKYFTVSERTSLNYSIRNPSYFKLLPFRTEIKRQSIKIRGPKLWHSLPLELQNSCSLTVFKREYLLQIFSSYNECD